MVADGLRHGRAVPENKRLHGATLAYARGLEQVMKSQALNMLNHSKPLKEIMQTTGLTLKEIQSLAGLFHSLCRRR